MTGLKPSAELLTFNGVNAATGLYGLAPMTARELARCLHDEERVENLAQLRLRAAQRDGRCSGAKAGVDPKRLDQAGWAVIFAHEVEPMVREALAPLIEMRREQAGDRFRLFETFSESCTQFLVRHHAAAGPADPQKVPYYLLLVGSPEQISFGFQSQLSVQHAVGRLHFGRAEDYAHYAESVLAAESGTLRLPKRMSFFCPEHAGDAATRLSGGSLVAPLLEALRAARPDWQIDAYCRETAVKANLGRLLGGTETPALLFAAAHGVELPWGEPRLRRHQGALVCGNWPGPAAWKEAIPKDFYFTGDDVRFDASLLGLVAFFFASHGGGTPRLDELVRLALDRPEISPDAFSAALPQALLRHPRGGALAVVAQAERVWSHSVQTSVFESVLGRLLDDHPVGSALEPLKERHAELSTLLADRLEELEFRPETAAEDLAGLWTANKDIRGFVILGDPAVRLPVAAPPEESAERPVSRLVYNRPL